MKIKKFNFDLEQVKEEEDYYKYEIYFNYDYIQKKGQFFFLDNNKESTDRNLKKSIFNQNEILSIFREQSVRKNSYDSDFEDENQYLEDRRYKNLSVPIQKFTLGRTGDPQLDRLIKVKNMIDKMLIPMDNIKFKLENIQENIECIIEKISKDKNKPKTKEEYER